MIDIEKLSKILVPSDDIMRDLTREADEKLKNDEAERKAKMIEMEMAK